MPSCKKMTDTPDLCAYFFLRVKQLLYQDGQCGLVATNTIAQGDTREVGLDQLVEEGWTIPRAVSSRRWPGTASLEIAHIWLRKGSWHESYLLDEKTVDSISSFLTSQGFARGKPYALAANKGIVFKGHNVQGIGFVLEPGEASTLLKRNQANKDVLFPYLNGEDLNSRPDQSPGRWVINFHYWPL
jgi:hypothetical protein